VRAESYRICRNNAKLRPLRRSRSFKVICAKTAELIEMPFGVLARMGPRNYVLDDGPDVLKDVAMATNFWTKFGIPGFM